MVVVVEPNLVVPVGSGALWGADPTDKIPVYSFIVENMMYISKSMYSTLVRDVGLVFPVRV